MHKLLFIIVQQNVFKPLLRILVTELSSFDKIVAQHDYFFFRICIFIMYRNNVYHKDLIIMPQRVRSLFSFQKLCKLLGLFRKGGPSFKSHKGGLNKNESGQSSN